MAVLDWSTGSQVSPVLITVSRVNKKKWESFSMAVWALAHPAMHQEAHLMFQSEARFSVGLIFLLSQPTGFSTYRAKGLLSLAPHHLAAVLIPTNPNGPTSLSFRDQLVLPSIHTLPQNDIYS